MHGLPDDIYDVIVVDAEQTDDGDIRIELAITLGPHVGRMVAVRARHVAGAEHDAAGEALSLLGVPGTLRVRGGEPVFHPEQS